MFQKNNTDHKYDHRRTFILQSYFTYPRKSNHDVDIQLLYMKATDLQNQINNITLGSGGSEPNPDIGNPNELIIIIFYNSFKNIIYTNTWK